MKIGVVTSEKTNMFLESKFPTRKDSGWYHEGCIEALKENSIPYEIITDSHLKDLNKIKDYSALFMENNLCVTDEMVKVLKQYHSQGGGIVAMFGSTARYEDGKIRPDFGLAKEFHVSCGADPETEQWNEQPFGYICLKENHPIFKGLEIGDKLMYSRILIPIWSPRLSVNAGKVVATLGDFIKNDLDLPAIVVSENGNSRCVYSGPSISYRISQKQITKDTEKLKRIVANSILWVCKEL